MEEDRCQAIPAKARGHAADSALLPSGELKRRYRQMTGQPRLRPEEQTAGANYRRSRRETRHAQYQSVRALFAQGVSQREIARSLGLSRKTMTRFVQAATFPERAAHPPRPRGSLDPYKAYVRQRCQAGCWNGMQLYEEILTLGFTGSQPTVRNFLVDVRQKQHLVGDASALLWDATHNSVILPGEHRCEGDAPAHSAIHQMIQPGMLGMCLEQRLSEPDAPFPTERGQSLPEVCFILGAQSPGFVE